MRNENLNYAECAEYTSVDGAETIVIIKYDIVTASTILYI